MRFWGTYDSPPRFAVPPLKPVSRFRRRLSFSRYLGEIVLALTCSGIALQKPRTSWIADAADAASTQSSRDGLFTYPLAHLGAPL